MDGAESAEGMPDSSSIRPVSSLLSHFEHLNTPTTAAHTSRPTTPSQTTFKPQDHPAKLAQPPSLQIQDVSRSTTSSASTDRSGSEQKGVASQAHAKRRPPSPPKSRPVSMLPASTKKSYPRVDVTSPQSPPKSITVPRRRSFDPREQNASSSQSDIFQPMSAPGVRNSSEADTFLQPAQSQRPNLTNGSDSVREELLPTNIRNGTSPQNLSPAPPPINRAAKPRLASEESKTSGQTLQPTSTTKPEQRKVSPFNSPPTSSEGSPADEEPPPIPLRSKPTIPPENTPVSAEFAPSRRHNTIAGKREDPNEVQGESPPSQREIRNMPVTTRGSAGTAEETLAKPLIRSMTDIARDPDSDTTAQRPRPTTRPSALTQGFASKGDPIKPGRSTSTPRLPPQATAIQTSQVRNPTPPPQPSRESSRPPPPPRPTNAGSDYDSGDAAPRTQPLVSSTFEYPDTSSANRRPPYFPDGPRIISNGYDTRLFDVCGENVCTSGAVTRVWNLLTGKLLLSLSHGESVKITSLCFKPGRKIEDEGSRLWLGTNWGELLEVDIASKKIVGNNPEAHPRREVVRIQRHATELWTFDGEGRLNVWPPDDKGSPQLTNYVPNPSLPRGYTTSIVVGDELWHATGKEIRVFKPSAQHEGANIQVVLQSLAQPGTGEVVAAALVPTQPDNVYFGHSDGKITILSRKDYSCIEVVNVSTYRLTSLVGVGKYLWVSYNTGSIFVYDTSVRPWRVKKDWKAHNQVITGMVADRSSIWKLDRLQVLSLDLDNVIGVWDGMLKDDWLDDEMKTHEAEFCSFNELSALVVTWNVGASKPTDLRYDESDSNFYRELFQSKSPPDIIVFGLQELVDLEDKKLTAKNFFKGKSKDTYGQDHLSSVYRAWRDDLSLSIEDHMPTNEPYILLHTASLVGLFTCIFVRAQLKSRISDVHNSEVKTGMSGLYGNKGALIVRFMVDDSSLCFVNCHLAAGQSGTANRNQDIAAILETAPLPALYSSQSGYFVSGGDGSMIMDHELCILNGDLNYRIDTMTRDTVISAVRSNNLTKLLERDQLLLSRRKNPVFRLRAFSEAPINFAPTYKYDIGTDNYDSSDKRRAPAWCDRILFRGNNRIEQLAYRRHEVRVSDHRPVSGRFKLMVKSVEQEKRSKYWDLQWQQFEMVKELVSTDAKLHYLVNVFGLEEGEAERLLGS